MTTTRFPSDLPPIPPAPPLPTAPEHEGGADGPSQDHSRAGAVWVTATGAFLLFAASAVFVAVQWNHLSNEVKLGILAALTGACLLAGRRLRGVLPATAGVIAHLGAFLIPVNVAAVLVHEQTPWESFLLVQGLVAAVAWTLLGRVEHSPVLRAAAGVAVVVAAGGIAATTSAPAALVLAGAAVLAEIGRRRPEAIAWSVTAGLAPVLALAERALPFGTDVLTTLGLAGATPRLTALASGSLAAIVLARNAQRRHDLVLVVVAAMAAAVGLVSGWVGMAPGRAFNIVGIATVFLIAELVAHAVRKDTFWRQPGHTFAVIAETITAILTPVGLLAALWVLGTSSPRFSWPELLAGAIVAVAWFVADLRRRTADTSGMALSLLVGGGWTPATLGLTGALATGITLGTASAPIVAAGAIVTAAALVLAGRPFGHAVAVPLVLGATAIVGHDPAVCAAAAVIGSLVLASAAVVRARMGDRPQNGPIAWVLATAATLPLVEAHLLLHGRVDELTLLAGSALAAWAVAALLERAATEPDMQLLPMIGRVAALSTLAAAFDAPPMQLAILAGLLSGLAVIDALRLRLPHVLFGLPITVPAMVGTGALAAGLTIPQAGLALCVLAAVTAGIHLLLEGDWRWPVLGVVLASAVSGFTLASTSLGTASSALLVLGGIGLAYSSVFATPEGMAFSGLGITAGIWGHLADAHVVALDAYLAPVALLLVIAGIRASTSRVSSWVAYAPAIVMLGGSALLERMHNGAGVHAVVAGAVGVAAVLAGGTKRLIAPLLLGTGLLVGLTAHESLGVTREVPTWGWLALGGTVLLLAGIAMERLDTDPMESGRRVVDIVHESFS
jgi:hypothetical protein